MIHNPVLNKSGGIDTSDATASASTILSPYTAYVNDEKVTGAIPTSRQYSQNLATFSQFSEANEYYSLRSSYVDNTGSIIRRDTCLPVSVTVEPSVSYNSALPYDIIWHIQFTLSHKVLNNTFSNVICMYLSGYSDVTYNGSKSATFQFNTTIYPGSWSVGWSGGYAYAMAQRKCYEISSMTGNSDDAWTFCDWSYFTEDYCTIHTRYGCSPSSGGKVTSVSLGTSEFLYANAVYFAES